MPEPTLEILGRYKILRVIGRGAMGIVYEAIDPDIDRIVAIKTINLMLSAEEMVQYEARFKQEIKAAGRLNHPNIVTIYDVGKTDNMAYMAMEFISGCELKDLLRDGVPLPIDVALDIIAQSAEGLAFAHSRDIIHRDVKPANIMLLENEEGLVAKITDFGIARMPASAVKTMTGMVMGSPRYMSPEQVIGKNLSARSDIFSLGVVLYESLTGLAPFEADSISSIMYQTVHAAQVLPSSVNPNLDPDLDAVIAKALAKSPEDRFDTMKAFARKLREIIRSRSGESAFSLAQLRTSAGLPATSALQQPATPPEGGVSLGISLEVDGTRLVNPGPIVAAKVVEPVQPPVQVEVVGVPTPAPAPASSTAPPPASIARVAPVDAQSTTPTSPSVTKSPQVAAKPPDAVVRNDIAERTIWPVAVANQFDSTLATMKLAAITAQTGELSEFISASRLMPAFKEVPPPTARASVPVTVPAPVPATAKARAGITLTMDALPFEPRKIPMPSLLLLGGLGSTVIILLVALLLMP